MAIKNINLATVKETGVRVSRKLAEKIAQEAKNIQPEVKAIEMLKKIDEIPSETLRANLIPRVKKVESIYQKCNKN